MTDGRCLMVVHAHPDDEVFSTGGTLARYASEGARVVVVYCTRGEAGEMHHPELTHEDAMPRLGDLREAEVREACRMLGVTDVFFLGYRDSGMKETPENEHPDAFMNAPLDEATDRLLAIMRETEPQVLVTYDEEGGYGHPDHIMAHKITVEAFERARNEEWGPEKLYFPERSREGFRTYVEALRERGLEIPWISGDFNFDEYGLPDEQITTFIDISRWAALKPRVLAVHRTQIPGDFFYLQMPDDMMERYQGVEYYTRVAPPPQPGERETDLFAGTRRREAAA